MTAKLRPEPEPEPKPKPEPEPKSQRLEVIAVAGRRDERSGARYRIIALYSLNEPAASFYADARLIEGAATPSIMIFTQAGNPDRCASVTAGSTSLALVTSFPKPPNAAVTLS